MSSSPVTEHDSMVDHRAWARAGLAVTAASLLGAGWLLVQGRWGEAAILGLFVLGAVVPGLWWERLPRLFTLLFAVAAGVNALGYVLELWESPAWFDEAVHVLTPFVLMAALGWALMWRGRLDPHRPGPLVAVLAGTVLVVGLLWEGFEWAVGLIGSPQDTAVDLAMDVLGGLLAAAFCIVVGRMVLSATGAIAPRP